MPVIQCQLIATLIDYCQTKSRLPPATDDKYQHPGITVSHTRGAILSQQGLRRLLMGTSQIAKLNYSKSLPCPAEPETAGKIARALGRCYMHHIISTDLTLPCKNGDFCRRERREQYFLDLVWRR
jgi:hypothetical protein